MGGAKFLSDSREKGGEENFGDNWGGEGKKEWPSRSGAGISGSRLKSRSTRNLGEGGTERMPGYSRKKGKRSGEKGGRWV